MKSQSGVLAKLLDIAILAITAFYVWTIIDLLFAGEKVNPFYHYSSNYGVRVILMTSLVVSIVLVFATLLFLFSKKEKPILWIAQIISAIALAILHVIELYYSSTFYYGEVRDKQGSMFPYFSLILIGYAAIKYFARLSEKKNRQQSKSSIIF